MTFSKQVIFSILLSASFFGSIDAMEACVAKGAEIGVKGGAIIGACVGFLVGIPAEGGKYCYNKVFPIIRKHPGSAVAGLTGVVAAGVIVYYVLRSHKVAVQQHNEATDSVNQVAVPI